MKGCKSGKFQLNLILNDLNNNNKNSDFKKYFAVLFN